MYVSADMLFTYGVGWYHVYAWLTLSCQVHDWHIKVHGCTLGQSMANWNFQPQILKPSPFTTFLLTLNTKIMNKQSAPLSLIKLFYTCDP